MIHFLCKNLFKKKQIEADSLDSNAFFLVYILRVDIMPRIAIKSPSPIIIHKV